MALSRHLFSVALFGLLSLFSAKAHGWDRRLALLVVNQKGWAQDPPLQYALEGDLRPLAQELRRLGFEVIEVVNQPPRVLRQTFQTLHKRLHSPAAISTFLFYYSGHADPQALHMGPKSKDDFSYREFATTFRSLPVKRRFAIFDACFSGEIIRHFGSLHRYKRLRKEGRMKGIKQASSINLSQLAYPNQGEEEGFRIIASSLQVSWELNRYRASVFTYHLLRGLRGKADLDKDGKISVDELFDFTSRAVQRITHQKPQQLVVTQREQPYALAPAYQSRLRIGADVLGDLQVSVANFVWSYNKSSRLPLTLAAVDGKATIRLKKKGSCLQQEVHLPKGGEGVLSTHWKPQVCQDDAASLAKGSLLIPAQVEWHEEPFQNDRSLAFWTGLASQGDGAFHAFQPALGFEFRWRWFQAGLHLTQSLPSDHAFSLTRLLLQGAAGWPFWFHVSRFHAELWLGAFVQGGIVWQHFPEGSGTFNLNTAFGGLVSLTWWQRHWGLRLHTSLGGDYLPIVGSHGFSLFWNLGLAVTWGV